MQNADPEWLAGITVVATDLAESFRAGLSPELDHAVRVTVLGDFSFAMYIMSYVLGLFVNLRDLPKLPLRRGVGLYVLRVALLPLYPMMEAAGVIYALVRPERGSHVIHKGASDAAVAQAASEGDYGVAAGM